MNLLDALFFEDMSRADVVVTAFVLGVILGLVGLVLWDLVGRVTRRWG